MTPGKRTYGDPCGIARALDVVGERWALLVVRELLLGPKRFTDLGAGLPNVGPDVLAQRLRELEANGLVARRTLAPPAGSKVYELTERGQELEPVILALGRWGSGAPLTEPLREIGPDSMVLALKTVFDHPAAAKLDATVALRLGEQTFSVRVGEGGIDAARGDADDPDAVLTTSAGVLAALVWEGLGLDAAVRAGDAAYAGDRRTLERFLGLFSFETVG
jgi:DNA-binding HxlR family transcriptional regulator